jgi:ATP-dependent 26S proteasome regulatory subunit
MENGTENTCHLFSSSSYATIHAEREYVESEDFMKAVRKVSDSKKLETNCKLDYKQI